MKIAAILGSLLCASVAGCASDADSSDQGLFTWVSSLDYAKRVCRNADLDDSATCINRMLAVYQYPEDHAFPPEQSTSGPFLITLSGRNYYGWYRSMPFRADFRASDGFTTCRGSYSAFVGDLEAVFAVSCDDGRRGSATVIHGQDGRNGIGTITMSDGDIGHIVFGRNALQGTPAAG